MKYKAFIDTCFLSKFKSFKFPVQNCSVVKKLLYRIMNFNDSGSSSYKFVSVILSNL